MFLSHPVHLITITHMLASPCYHINLHITRSPTLVRKLILANSHSYSFSKNEVPKKSIGMKVQTNYEYSEKRKKKIFGKILGKFYLGHPPSALGVE